MAETYTYRGLRIRIEQDTDAESPRTWDNLGTLLCWHRRYWLGDRDKGRQNKGPDLDPEGFRDWWKDNGKGGILLPLRLYDHSGISISAGSEYPLNDAWDSGPVGFCFVTRETILKEYGGRIVTAKKREQARKVLLAEVATYDQYLRGDVYGFTVEDSEGEYLDSCWGFIGFEFCKQVAEQVADHHADKAEASDAIDQQAAASTQETELP